MTWQFPTTPLRKLFPALIVGALFSCAFVADNAFADVVLSDPAIVDQEFGGSDITDMLIEGDTIAWVRGKITNTDLFGPATASYAFTLNGVAVTTNSIVTLAQGESKTVGAPVNPVSVASAGGHLLSLFDPDNFAPTVVRSFTVAGIHTVTFAAQDGDAAVPPTITVTNGLPYGTLAATTRQGFTFAGWYTNATATGAAVTAGTTVTATNDHTLYAKWSVNPIMTVTFDARGGVPVPVPITVTNGLPYGVLPTTARPGFTLAGWYTNAAATGAAITAATVVPATADHTLYAHWTANAVLIVSFDAQDGTAPIPSALTVTNGFAYGPLASTMRAGFIFAGWRTAANGAGDLVAPTTVVMALTNHILYAAWTPNSSLVISFDAQGGSVSIPATTTVTNGLPYGTLATTTRTGFTFSGWWTGANGTGNEVVPSSTVTVTVDHTLFAKWTPNVVMTLTFDPQGGSAPVPAATNVTFDAPYGPLPVTAREGYAFAGWWTGAAGAGVQITSSSVVAVTVNHTLYAKWTPHIYTVTFDVQHGQPLTVNATNVAFGTIYGPLPEPIRPGFTFAGWWRAIGGTGDLVTAATVVTVAADHTLYANWQLNPVMTVAFDTQSGTTPVPSTITVTNGLPYGRLAATTRTGYTLANWCVDASCTVANVTAASLVTATADHTLYANWTPNTYTVTFDAQGGAVTPTTTTVTFDTAYGPLPTPERHGYPPFEGWWTGANGGGTHVTAATNLTTAVNHTLYAKWYPERFGNYVVVDLSAGPAATQYPVAYRVDPPAEGWDNDHKTTHLVLKRVRAGNFMMGSPIPELGHEADEVGHNVTLSKDFFVGLFAVTQRQWELVMGTNPSAFTNGTTAATRPVEQISYFDLREDSDNTDADWPANDTAGAASFIGRLRARTGLGSLDLPTEAQWEYTCRAGTSTALNSNTNLTHFAKDLNLDKIGHYLLNGAHTNTTTSAVGAYVPNAWGFYDFHGNVWEWCRDWYAPYAGAVQDPKGPTAGTSRIIRGGAWGSLAHLCRSGNRNTGAPSLRSDLIGFRLSAELPRFLLTVNNGTGEGWYDDGTVQHIVADTPPADTRFSHWTVTPANTPLGAAFIATQPETSVTMPASDVAVAAVFAPVVTVIVSFDAQGGTSGPTAKTVTVGEPYGELPISTRTGHLFGGWWLTPAFTGAAVTAGTAVTTATPHTLYARWHEQGWNDGGDYICDPLEDAELTTAGAYDGFFYAASPFDTETTTSVHGTLNLRLTRIEGRLSAKIALQNGTVRLSTREWTEITPEGIRRATLTARTGETLDLFVLQNRIWGTLTGGKLGATELTLDGGRNRFADRADTDAAALLSDFRGSYTVALPTYAALSASEAVAAAPEGVGYLSITIRTRGSVKIAGLLADGTRVSRSSQLILYEGCTEAACVPLFAPLYAKKGSVNGLLWLTPQGPVVTDRDADWFIRWENPGKGPDGFSMLLDACGGFYNSASALTTGYRMTADTADALLHYADQVLLPSTALADLPLTLAGMRLTIPRGKRPARIADENGIRYEYDPVNPTQATLSFRARTGIFKGRFTLYYSTELNGRAVLNKVKASYGGILTPVRAAAFADQPDGMGYAIVPESDPAFQSLRLKRSYLVTLETE